MVFVRVNISNIIHLEYYFILGLNDYSKRKKSPEIGNLDSTLSIETSCSVLHTVHSNP